MSDIVLTKRAHHRSTLINGRYAHTSASQVSEFKRCPRKWYYKKVVKLEEPSNPAQARGKAVHSAIESFLETRQIALPVITDEQVGVDSEALAEYVSIAAPYLPEGDYEIEREVLLPTFEGGPLWVGYIDVRYPGVRIIDHKTTSDFRYAKTPEELRNDTQLNAYAHWEYEQGATGELEVAHLYLRTRGRKLASYVPALTTKDKVDEVWARDMETVRQMSALVERLGVTEDRAEEVDPNTEACGAYGGCYFRHRCGIGDFSLGSNIVSASMLARKTRELQAATSTSGALPEIQFNPRKETTMSFEQMLAEKSAKNLAQPPAATRPTPDKAPLPTNHAMPEAAPPGLSLEERLKRLPTSIVPDDAPVEEEVPPVAAPARRAVAPRPAAPATQTSPAAPLQFEAPLPSSAPPAMTAPFELEQVFTQARVQAGAERRRLTLYIDCFPVKGPDRATYVLAEEWLAPLMAKVAADNGVPDYRIIQYTAKALLAQEIRRALPTVPEAIAVASYGGGSAELLESLIPWATTVVRGK